MLAFPEAANYTPDELRIGLRAEFEREITEADVNEFARISGDFNPLHVDADYAETSTFGRPIVHGAFQVGLASALLGMQLPGRSVLLGSINARFPAPLMFPNRVKVRGEITAWNSSRHTGQVKVVVLEQHGGVPTAELVLGFTLHNAERSTQHVERNGTLRVPPSAIRTPAVLVTGAAGGLGSAIIDELVSDYHVLALVNRESLAERFQEMSRVTAIAGDLTTAEWQDTVRTALDRQPLYGVIHAAWPGSPHGGLLDSPAEVIERQLAFGTLYPIELAKMMRNLAGTEGGRIVLLGSLFGTHRPLLNRAAYSLGKAALEHTMKLLAPELARKNITINIVGPAFVPVGMNQASSDRHLKLEVAQVPLGRLCTAQDVAQSVRYLLSPGASFVSGQFLGLSGGQV